MLKGVYDIIGQDGIDAVFKHAQQYIVGSTSPSDPIVKTVNHNGVCSVQLALEGVYGTSSGRGITYSAGRSSFNCLLRQFAEQMGMLELDFRMLPTIKRIGVGLQALAEQYSSLISGEILFKDAEEAWYWRVAGCPWCYQRNSNEKLCYFTVGLVQEFVSWVSGGNYCEVSETNCMAYNRLECVIRIDKHSLD